MDAKFGSFSHLLCKDLTAVTQRELTTLDCMQKSAL